MTKTSQITLLILCICSQLFTACSKKEIQEVDNETQSVADYAIADQEFMSIVHAVYQGLAATKGTGASATTTLVTCDTLTYLGGDTSTFSPNTQYALSVANTSCAALLSDSKARSGKILVRLTGKVKKDSKIIVKLSNYMADNISYYCDSLVFTTLERTAASGVFNVTLINGTCKTGTATINYRFNRTFSIYPNGDFVGEGGVCYAFGEASGTNRQGINFSTNVSQDAHLVKHATCRYIDKGVMELTPEGFKTRVIDFGNGTCDDEGTFTVKENTVAFKLK